eukprot:GHRQ01016960.1.p1 GENE.GHRQ01016960.1~~GHRQ01016960.1.p1  ORF type:complete len:292 (+),score=48.71 GHRQ01016960.1:377-1252(+)
MWRVNCLSTSTHRRQYPGAQLVTWELQSSHVKSYLEAKLGGVVMQQAPCSTGSYCEPLQNQEQVNVVFAHTVGMPVADVLSSLGTQVFFTMAPSADAEKGQADFVIWCGDTEVATGEGKVPSVMRVITNNIETTGASYIRSCAEQACSYIKSREHRYGFLTHLHGTFFIKRTADDSYAFSKAVLCTDTQPSVAEALAYIIMKSVEEGPWKYSGQSEPGAIPASALGQDASRAAHQSQGSYRRSPRPAAADQQGQPGQQGQQCSYPRHPQAALVLSDITLGRGQTGRVRLAR